MQKYAVIRPEFSNNNLIFSAILYQQVRLYKM